MVNKPILPKLILLSTAGCHLCEHALELIDACQLEVEIIDIAEQESWQENYALHIPVLYAPVTQAALYWPFNASLIEQFVAPLMNGAK